MGPLLLLNLNHLQERNNMPHHSTTFNFLGIDAKARVILEHGVYVTSSEFYQIEITLYKIDDEFVEIWYDTKREEITRIDRLNTQSINPFLKHFATISEN